MHNIFIQEGDNSISWQPVCELFLLSFFRNTSLLKKSQCLTASKQEVLNWSCQVQSCTGSLKKTEGAWLNNAHHLNQECAQECVCTL